MHSSRRDPARPQNALSGLGCVVFTIAVNVSCHVGVRVTPLSFSSGLGTGNGGVPDWYLDEVLLLDMPSKGRWGGLADGPRAMEVVVPR